MPLGNTVHRLESVASTNDEARALALAGAAHGTAVVAEEQTRGRGTKGRLWHSPRGLGLYVSFILRPPAAPAAPILHRLPLAAGLAAADAAGAASGVAVGLKWPNDIVHGGKKLGGILCEGVSGGSAGDFAVVGVGLNVNHGPADFPEALRGSAASLRQVAGRAVPIGPLFAGLCRALEDWYNALVRGEGGAVIQAFQDRMAFRPGASLRVTTDEGSFIGVFRGLDAEGRLVVDRGGSAGTAALDAVLGLEEI